MEDIAHSSKGNAGISVSRNSPLCLVVGVAGFVGSHLAQKFLSKGVSVVGIDDLSTGHKSNLAEVAKDKNFHFLHRSIADDLSESNIGEVILNLPRIDYIFWAVDAESLDRIYAQGLGNFLQLLKKIRGEQVNKLAKERKDLSVKALKELEDKARKDKPKITFVSSVSLYNNKVSGQEEYLKEAEIRFARFVRTNKFNARVVRLAPLYGPRMHFRVSDPLVRLIQSSLTDQLEEQMTSMDFTTRALFIDDAVDLLVKSVLVGSTSNKIYDGALVSPIKIVEIKQILLDPLWHEERGFKETELPPFPTPNLDKTMSELAWKPKTKIVSGLKETVSYFKENEIKVDKLSGSQIQYEEKEWMESENPSYISKEELKKWSFKNTEESVADEKEDREFKVKKMPVKGGKSRLVGFLVALLIIFLGLIYPFLSLGFGAMNIRNNLKDAKSAIEVGDFERSEKDIKEAKKTLVETRELLNSLAILKRLGFFNRQLDQADQLLSISEEGISGVDHAVLGSKALYLATKVVSGEQNSDAVPLYQQAQFELKSAKDQIGSVKSILDDEGFISYYPTFLRERARDLSIKLDLFSGLVDKAYTAAILLPNITGVDGKKSYLVLLQNNLELRPGGGFIGSYAKLDFDKGKITNIKVDDIYALDGGLKDVIEPPANFKTDLGQNRLYLRDANFEPDFPSSARQAELLYKKESGEVVNGVIAMNLSASAALLEAVGGVDLPEFNENVDGKNLFAKAISHAEVNFFPGSQAKKNYLTALQLQLFNKIFYLSKQNWPAIIEAVSSALDEKQIQVYLSDPVQFSYLASQNWAGVMPRGKQATDGVTEDFLSIIESNMGANKSNYYLSRKINLQTAMDKEGKIFHKLKVDYANTSPSDTFPAGKYKNRFKIYLPLGAKITDALWGETVITSQLAPFSDYGRSGYTALVTLNPKEQKSLIINYALSAPLNFKDNLALYNLTVFKQSGTDRDALEWHFSYPINFNLVSGSEGVKSNQEVLFSTDLLKDRIFSLSFSK